MAELEGKIGKAILGLEEERARRIEVRFCCGRN